MSKVTVLDFTAAWCPPCKALTPILEGVVAKHGAQLVTIDVDVDQEAASRYGVRGMPTVVVLRDDHEVERFIGLRSERFVNEVLTRACSARAPSSPGGAAR